VNDVLGFPLVVPAHQGRGAESVFFGAIIDPGEIVPSNAHFDTTRAHIEVRQGVALDLPVPESLDPAGEDPFKGNMDTAALAELLDGPESERVSIVMLTITNNAGGGQPVSIANIREAARLAHEHGKKFVLDIARFAENAWFVKAREPRYSDTPLPEIVHEMVGEADAVLMSAKKDALANIGGFVAIREDQEFFQRLQARGIVFEGFPTYGGLAGRDLEAIAVGLHEVLDESYLRHRVEQVAYLGPKAACAASRSARSWRAAIPRQARTGVLPLELVRLAVPRRVYTSRQLEQAGDAAAAVLADGESVRGLEMVSEAPVLRHFTARFSKAVGQARPGWRADRGASRSRRPGGEPCPRPRSDRAGRGRAQRARPRGRGRR
jgi:tyrosine phenol-lyase